MAAEHRISHSSAPGANWFGLYKELGKTEARQLFLRLLDELRQESTTVAITDRGEPVAVIMGYKQYELLVTALNQGKAANEQALEGLIIKAGDLEADNQRIKRLFRKSLQKTRKNLK